MRTLTESGKYVEWGEVLNDFRTFFFRIRKYFGWDGLSYRDLTALLLAEISIVVWLGSLMYLLVINLDRYRLTFMVRREFGVDAAFSMAIPFVPLLLSISAATVLGVLVRAYVTKAHVEFVKKTLSGYARKVHKAFSGNTERWGALKNHRFFEKNIYEKHS